MKRVLRSIAIATAFVATCVAAQAADLPMQPADTSLLRWSSQSTTGRDFILA